MNYSDKPNHCLVTRFRASGKWYDEFQIDMSDYYYALNIYDAVAKAIEDTGHYKMGDEWIYVCLDPYHHSAYPVMIVGTYNISMPLKVVNIER